MDKEGCGLQRQRAQEVGALLRLLEKLTEHMLGHASTEMTKPWLPIKCREKQNPLSLQALGSLEQAVSELLLLVYARAQLSGKERYRPD